MIACPGGHAPVATKIKKGKHTATFDHAHCNACPLKATCPGKDGKKYRYLHYEDKDRRIAIRRTEEQSDEFIEKYRWRSGIEATMSEYEKKTGVKRLNVRGFASVRLCALLKAIGINLFRAAAVRKAINAFQRAPRNGKSDLDCVILVFKELSGTIWEWMKQIFSSQVRYHVHELKNGA